MCEHIVRSKETRQSMFHDLMSGVPGGAVQPEQDL